MHQEGGDSGDSGCTVIKLEELKNIIVMMKQRVSRKYYDNREEDSLKIS